MITIATSRSIADVDHAARASFPQRLKNPRGKRLQILEAVRWRPEDDHRDLDIRQVLLILEPLIRGDEDVERAGSQL